ncbi:MAG: potassium channel family protein [Thermoleophilaceae bacterium]|nr:potassium channel family protein [Thermoleophilaceae bacterium]
MTRGTGERVAPCFGEHLGMSTGRLETFSDGVFAVAITLLVLDIRPPSDADTSSGLWRSLGDLWPHYTAYAVSFLVIGIVWSNHHAVMDVIGRVDRQLVFLNLLLLMAVALIPFGTALLAEYLTRVDAAHAAAAAYSVVIALMGAAFGGLWIYVSRDGRLLVDDFPRDELPEITRRFVIGTPIYIAAIGIAFVSAVACLALHAVLAVYYALARRGGGLAMAHSPRGVDP